MAPSSPVEQAVHSFVEDGERKVLSGPDLVEHQNQSLRCRGWRLVVRTMLGSEVVGELLDGVDPVFDIVRIQTWLTGWPPGQRRQGWQGIPDRERRSAGGSPSDQSHCQRRSHQGVGCVCVGGVGVCMCVCGRVGNNAYCVSINNVT